MFSTPTVLGLSVLVEPTFVAAKLKLGAVTRFTSTRFPVDQSVMKIFPLPPRATPSGNVNPVPSVATLVHVDATRPYSETAEPVVTYTLPAASTATLRG